MKNVLLGIIVLLNAALITGCDSGGGSASIPTIVISGVVSKSSDSQGIDKAQVSIINVETQQNELDPVYTGTTGAYTFTVTPGTYEIRVAAQGYLSSPVDGIAGIPLSSTQTFDVALDAITGGGTFGLLKLNLLGYNNVNGALVIMSHPASTEKFTAVTSTTGALMMYNLPTGDYDLTVKALGHETHNYVSNVTISTDAETVVNDITLIAISGFTVSGKVKFLATSNSEVDVGLTDPGTGAVIPGTNVTTSNANYVMNSVAPGTYYIRATYNIDGLVVDPDSIVKFGEPEAVVTNANLVANDIDVTDAVVLNGPILDAEGFPAVVTTLTPTLSWDAYPSTSDYVVEVLDVNGNVIWGGFGPNPDYIQQVTTTELSVVYNFDGAGLDLVNGKTYRWKVYASFDDGKEATGWKLISASEDAQGIFKIVEP